MTCWVKSWKDGKIVRHESRGCERRVYGAASLFELLSPALALMDLPMPVILEKHVREINEFKRTVFSAKDNIERVDYDKLDVEIFDEKDAPKYNKKFE